jgi:hypothetical protein
MAFIDQMTITEFKGRICEEARRLNACGLTLSVGAPACRSLRVDPSK